MTPFHHFTLLTLVVFHVHSRQKNKGTGVELSHFLGDGLYQVDEIE
jgi:predicted ribosome-associated RNA-binding protein Tma20